MLAPMTKRPFIPNKAHWAASRAVELRQQARELRFESSGGFYARAARKMETIRRLEAEASRFERLEARLRAQAA